MAFTVGVDGYNLALPTGTGIATYARTLTSAIKAMGGDCLGVFDLDVGDDVELQEVLFFDRLEHSSKKKRSFLPRWMRPRARLPQMVEIARGVVDHRPVLERIPDFDRIATGPALFQAAFHHFRRTGRMASMSIQNPPDIMHWTCPIPLRMEGAKNVYTVHDLVPLRMPYMTLDNKRMFHAITAACMAEGDRICSVSQVTAEELSVMFPAETHKVVTTYQSCDISEAVALSDQESRAVVERMGFTPGGYFLFYGALEPKKNVARLIEAHARMKGDTPLVIVTGRSWNAHAEQALIDRMRSERLVVLEFLPRGMLQALIAHARAVTFPSLHEGFGLPVLEAMRLGVPVLTGNSGGVIEVAGEGGLLVDPYDVSAIQRGLECLDADAAFRRSLADAGRVQSEKFSPERYMNLMSSVYKNLLAN